MWEMDNGWINERLDGWMDGLMDEFINVCMDEWMNGHLKNTYLHK